MESEVVVLVSETRGRKRSLSTAHPQQKRGQQAETLTRVRANKNVAASADGEQPLAGPLIIAAVIGHPLGRWGELCATEHASGAQSVLLEGPAVATGSDTGNSPCEDTKGLPALHGFMLVRSWQWSSSRQTSSSAQEERMTSVLQQIHHKSTHLEILKHDIVSVAALPEPLLVEQLDLSRLPSGLGDKLADKAKDSTFTVIRHCCTSTGHCVLNGFANLRTHWAGSVATGEPVYMWPLCTQLANHIVHGHWKVDLSAVPPRLDQKFWRAPVQPSVRQLTLIRANRPLANHSPDIDVASATSEPLHSTSKRKWHGAVPGVFDPEHMFRAVVDGKNLTNQKSAEETMRSSVRLGLPLQENALDGALESQALQVPGRKSLTTGRVRLDVVAMLASRELYSRRGPLFRYLASDASPQADQSVEVFVSVERIIVRSAVTGKAMTNIIPDNLVERLLPICTLGHSRTDLASKVMTQASTILCASMRIPRHCHLPSPLSVAVSYILCRPYVDLM
jgi:hypothetical protein